MRITKIDHVMVYIPYDRPHLWSTARRPGMTRLVLQVQTDEDIVGYGETICLWEQVQPVLAKTVIPLAIGEDPRNIERLYRKMEGAGFYHHKRALVAAMCGLEIACWDIIGKIAGQPLCNLIGGKFRDRVEMVAYLYARPPKEYARDAAEYVTRGFKTVKVKIGLDPDLDIETVTAVREAIGPKIKLRADVNGAWTPGTAKRQVRKLEEFDLEYIEQPLPPDDLFGLAELRRVSRIPIAIDESAFTNWDTLNVIRAGAADVILVDPHEAGGIWAAKKAAAIAEAAGIPCSIHGPGECGISMAARLHLAVSTPNISLAVDSEHHDMTDDIITKPFTYDDGMMAPPDGPGLGVELDVEKLNKYKTDRIRDAYLSPSQESKSFSLKPAY